VLSAISSFIGEGLKWESSEKAENMSNTTADHTSLKPSLTFGFAQNADGKSLKRSHATLVDIAEPSLSA